MTTKENVEYVKNVIDKWNQIKEKLESDDKFLLIIEQKLNDARKKLVKIKENHPEDFLV